MAATAASLTRRTRARLRVRQKRLTLGRFPAVSLAHARELARDAQRTVAEGGDPTEKRAARDVLTFE